jgi:hypothetical protein
MVGKGDVVDVVATAAEEIPGVAGTGEEWYVRPTLGLWPIIWIAARVLTGAMVSGDES